MMRHFLAGIVALAALIWLAGGQGAAASEVLPGPVPAKVLRVIDGDTRHVVAHVWLGQTIEVRVRLEGVDTPEMRGRCSSERDLAQKARAWLAAQVSGRSITLRDVQLAKFAGRVVARVVRDDGKDLSVLLLEAGLARPYAGGRRTGWCG